MTLFLRWEETRRGFMPFPQWWLHLFSRALTYQWLNYLLPSLPAMVFLSVHSEKVCGEKPTRECLWLPGLDSYYSSFGNSLKNHSWILLSHLDGSPVFCPCSHTGECMLISHLSSGAPDFPQIPSYLVFLQHQSSIGSEKSYDFLDSYGFFLP